MIIALFAKEEVFSQVKGKVRGGADFGIPMIDKKSIVGGINLGYNLQDNMNVGIRWHGLASQSYGTWSGEPGKNGKSTNSNFTGYYTYYLKSHPVAPFIGGGLGLYILNARYSIDYNYGYYKGNKTGGFLTTGFEFGKFRLAAEITILPETLLTIYERHPYEQRGTSIIDEITIKNSHLAITVGFYVGGGNRKKILELERQMERERQESFSYFALNYVERELALWAQRGEFERTVDWQERVTEASRQAKIAELSQTVEKAYIDELSRNMPVGNITLGAYDADNEVFLISNTLYGDWLASVPLHEAPQFRDNWSHVAKTLKWEIQNDRIAFAGYSFEDVRVAESVQTPSGTSGVVQSSPAQRGKRLGAGAHIALNTNKNLPDFGVGAQFRFNVAKRIRLDAAFTYFIPKNEEYTENIPDLFTGAITKKTIETTLKMWDLGFNVHFLLPLSDKITVYPLSGLSIIRNTTNTSGIDVTLTAPYFNVGAGLDLHLNDNVGIFLEPKFLAGLNTGFTVKTGIVFKF